MLAGNFCFFPTLYTSCARYSPIFSTRSTMQTIEAAEAMSSQSSLDEFHHYLLSVGVRTAPMMHQMEGIKFMVRREGFPNRLMPSAGILADDMGLGKTFQSIATAMIGKKIGAEKMPTLIVTSKILLNQWFDEIVRHTVVKPAQILMYYGADRKSKVNLGLLASSSSSSSSKSASIEGPMFVLTTYHTLLRDYVFPPSSHDVPPIQTGYLFRNKWARVILDEAHFIRNQASKMSKTCCEINAHFRWCLTGTAFNNRASDLTTLCKFMHLEPFASPHWWAVATPEEVASWRDTFVLRRTKEVLNLPPMKETRHIVPVTPEEEQFYERIVEDSTADFNNFLKSSGISRSRQLQALLVWLLRMRQSCNDFMILLGRHMTWHYARLARGRPKVSQCAACDEMLVLSTVPTLRAKCGHVLCAKCFEAAKPCPYCVDRKHSSKTTFLVERLRAHLAVDASCKMLVYSQWTSYLDCIEHALRDANISHLRLDGNISSTEERSAILEQFSKDSTSVLLMSTQVGSLGLNITAASRVFFMDLWYNPMVEMQAKNRVHRIGQTRPVEVEFIQTNLMIEEAILEMQQKKRNSAMYYMDGIDTPTNNGGAHDKQTVGGGGGVSAWDVTDMFTKIMKQYGKKRQQAMPNYPVAVSSSCSFSLTSSMAVAAANSKNGTTASTTILPFVRQKESLAVSKDSVVIPVESDDDDWKDDNDEFVDDVQVIQSTILSAPLKPSSTRENKPLIRTKKNKKGPGHEKLERFRALCKRLRSC